MTSLVYSWFTQWKMVIVHIFLGYLAKLLNHSFFCDAIFNTKFRWFFHERRSGAPGGAGNSTKLWKYWLYNYILICIYILYCTVLCLYYILYVYYIYIVTRKNRCSKKLETPFMFHLFGVFVWYNPFAETMVDVGNETTYLGP
jgi:hypothetical protein